MTTREITQPDPIFAAIEAHKAAWRAANAESASDDGVSDEASEKCLQTLRRVCKTVPTTHEGLNAFVDYIGTEPVESDFNTVNGEDLADLARENIKNGIAKLCSYGLTKFTCQRA